METEMDSIGVCILFFEKPEQTIECIQSVLSAGPQIYILNNNSSDRSRKALEEFCQLHRNIIMINSERNLGIGPGRNFLIREAKEKWLFFLDNDIIVKTRDWRGKVSRILQENSGIDAIVPKLYNSHEGKYSVCSDLEIRGGKVVHGQGGPLINFFPGGAALVRRDVFSRNGFYDEELFVGGEDFEICLRAILSGTPFRCLQAEDICLVHDHRKVKGKEDLEAANLRYNESIIKKSFDFISKKHNVEMDFGWQAWVDQQRRIMIEGETVFQALERKAKAVYSRLRWLK